MQNFETRRKEAGVRVSIRKRNSSLKQLVFCAGILMLIVLTNAYYHSIISLVDLYLPARAL